MTENVNGAQILLVDDDPGMLETLQDVLELKGYRVDVATDQPSTLSQVQQTHYDLILLDVLMPGFGGLQALKAIREMDPHVLVLLMTGYDAMEGTISDALAQGAHGVLYKPIDLQQIDEVLAAREEDEMLGGHMAVLDLKRYQIQPEALALVSESFARKSLALPLRIDGNSLLVAMANPNDIMAVDALQARTGLRVRSVQVAAESIQTAIDSHYRGREEIEREASYVAPTAPEAPPAEAQPGLAAESPIVRTLELLISQGIKDRASDIHIEPEESRVRVRYRVDGVLHDTASLPPTTLEPIMTRLKVLGRMNIAERRRPQDGQFNFTEGGREVEIRLATAPTLWGEMAALRLLDRSISLFPLDRLGMRPESLTTYSRMLRAPFGMILVAGPTGSGKTTTLYASLNQLDRKSRNVITIEDPIEYRFQDINQIQVNRQAGVDFATALRGIVRLDPDVIMVGEVRDGETAGLAIQAALTGHVVFSSIHANDAVSALVRLRDLGVENFLLPAAIVGVVAQRLVRVVCPECREPAPMRPDEAAAYEQELGEPAPEVQIGRGCSVCGRSGYTGRTGVFEVLLMTDELRRLVQEQASPHAIQQQAVADGMITMRRHGMLNVRDGITTPAEVLRSVYVIG